MSQDNVVIPARSLKRKGVEVFSLGIGNKFRRVQLQQMASSPSHVLTANFGKLSTILAALKHRACLPFVPRKHFIITKVHSWSILRCCKCLVSGIKIYSKQKEHYTDNCYLKFIAMSTTWSLHAHFFNYFFIRIFTVVVIIVVVVVSVVVVTVVFLALNAVLYSLPFN